MSEAPNPAFVTVPKVSPNAYHLHVMKWDRTWTESSFYGFYAEQAMQTFFNKAKADTQNVFVKGFFSTGTAITTYAEFQRTPPAPAA